MVARCYFVPEESWYQMVNEIDDELVEMIPAEMAFPIGIDATEAHSDGI